MVLGKFSEYGTTSGSTTRVFAVRLYLRQSAKLRRTKTRVHRGAGQTRLTVSDRVLELMIADIKDRSMRIMHRVLNFVLMGATESR